MIDAATADAMAAARLSGARLAHSRRVAAEAAAAARRFGGDPAAAEIAGLLHDYCRELTAEQMLEAACAYGIAVGPVERRRPVGLLHGPVAAAELADVGLAAAIAGAIARHTVGAPGMTVLEKCLYVADFCEPGREFPEAREVRELARGSLDRAVAAAARLSLLNVIGRGRGVAAAALDLYNEFHAGA